MRVLDNLIGRVRFSAWRLLLDTPHVRATSPMLRGVWGRALHFLDAKTYHEVFEGGGPQDRRVPRYIIRPAPADPATAPAIDFVLINVRAEQQPVLWEAWAMAGGMGLGPNRTPFCVRKKVPLITLRHQVGTSQLLARDWPIEGSPSQTPCTIEFRAPLRLLRDRKLLEQPAYSDIATAGARRLAALASLERGATYRDLQQWVRDSATQTPAHAWRGQRTDVVRWSAAQRKAVKLHGVTGSLYLPEGPGKLWTLLAYLRWLHVGKGTTLGMGQLDLC